MIYPMKTTESETRDYGFGTVNNGGLLTFRVLSLGGIANSVFDNITINKNSLVEKRINLDDININPYKDLFPVGVVGIGLANASTGGQGHAYSICTEAEVLKDHILQMRFQFINTDITAYTYIKIRVYVKLLCAMVSQNHNMPWYRWYLSDNP